MGNHTIPTVAMAGRRAVTPAPIRVPNHVPNTAILAHHNLT
jgi:hypothetical protein